MLKPVRLKRQDDNDFIPHVLRMAHASERLKARDIRAYDVRGLTVIADAFLVCSASSEPQMKAMINAVRADMKEAGLMPLHAEGVPGSGWLVLDYGNVIFHVFREEAREFYDLDGLWADAPAIALELDTR
jgi:ribosome-associated protein